MDNSSLNMKYKTETVNKTLSLLNRIWSKRSVYLIALPALILLLFLKVIPVLGTIWHAFSNYLVKNGTMSRQWVELDNFTELFSLPFLKDAVINTLILKSIYILLVGFLSLALTLALTEIHWKKLRNFLSTLFVVPFFIPSAFLAFIIYLLFSPDSYLSLDILQGNPGLIRNPWFLRLLYAAAEALKTCGIPIILALAAINAKSAQLESDSIDSAKDVKPGYIQTRLIPAVKAIGAFIIIQISFLLAFDIELLGRVLLGRTSSSLVTLDSSVVITHIGQTLGSALWLIKLIIQFAFSLMVYWILKKFFSRELFASDRKTADFPRSKPILAIPGFLMVLLYSFLALLPLFTLFVLPFLKRRPAIASFGGIIRTNSSFLSDSMNPAFLNYAAVSLIALLLHAFIVVTLAYPMTVRNLPAGRGYKLLILLILCLGTGAAGIAGGASAEYEFLKMKILRIHADAPLIIMGIFSMVNVLVLQGIVNSRYRNELDAAWDSKMTGFRIFFTVYLPRVWRPLIALSVFLFAWIWNSYIPALAFDAVNPEVASPAFRNLSPMLLFYKSSLGGDRVLLTYPYEFIWLCAMVILPPLLLFLIFRKFFKPETFISISRQG